jgi:tetratricopeptide (TPR) repeat protein
MACLIYIQLEDFEEVVVCSEKTLELDPLCFETLTFRGDALVKLNKPHLAIDCYLKALEILKSHENQPLAKLYLSHQVFSILQHSEEWQEVENLLENFSATPCPKMYHLLAIVCKNQKKWKKALDHVHAGIEMLLSNPQSPLQNIKEFWKLKSHIDYKMGNLQQAQKGYMDLFQISSSPKEAFVYLESAALLAIKRKDYENALSIMLGIVPTDAETHFKCARIYFAIHKQRQMQVPPFPQNEELLLKSLWHCEEALKEEGNYAPAEILQVLILVQEFNNPFDVVALVMKLSRTHEPHKSHEGTPGSFYFADVCAVAGMFWKSLAQHAQMVYTTDPPTSGIALQDFTTFYEKAKQAFHQSKTQPKKLPFTYHVDFHLGELADMDLV